MVNRLSLNLKKTNFVIFHSQNKRTKNLTLKINKKAIAESNTVKYLGINIDSTLTWKPHIDKLTRTISRALGVMYRIRSSVNMDILKTLYYALIYPHLNYAVETWGAADITHLNRVLILQKRIVRMITLSDKRHDDFSYPTANPLFKQLGFLKIQDIFILRISIFVYKCLNKSTPLIFHSWFTNIHNIHQYNTRSKYISIANNVHTRTLFIPSSRTTHYGLKQTKVLGAKIWNTLPNHLRMDDMSLPTFSKSLKKHLMEQNY